MDFPSFSVLKYGAFERTQANTRWRDRGRLISAYEFEFYTEDCEGGLHDEGTFYPVRKGSCTLFKPGQRQNVTAPSKGYFLNITTQDAELCDLLENLPNCFMLWNVGEVIRLIHRMIAIENQDTLGSRLNIQSCVCRIFEILSKYLEMPKLADMGVVRHQKILLDMDAYIRDHLSEDLSLDNLARQCNLDPTYFHKLYTAAFGKTPAQRILGFRIAAAKTGLIEGKLPLEELAYQCGFSSQTYFCYKFKKVTGLTPLQYRTQMLCLEKN